MKIAKLPNFVILSEARSAESKDLLLISAEGAQARFARNKAGPSTTLRFGQDDEWELGYGQDVSL